MSFHIGHDSGEIRLVVQVCLGFSGEVFLLLMASSFCVVRFALSSASAIIVAHSFFLTRLFSLSISEGIFSSAAVHVFSAVPSSDTSCRASSGQESMHFGSPPHRSQAMAMRFSGSRAMPPYGQAWMHQSQAEHFFSSTFMMPFSDCTSASSGQALMHGASSQNLQVTAALSNGVMRMTCILEPSGVQCSHFSEAQTYSQMPQPVHLKGSTETNLREVDLACCSCLVIGYALVEFLC